mgnify:CR=1 FL=1
MESTKEIDGTAIDRQERMTPTLNKRPRMPKQFLILLSLLVLLAACNETPTSVKSAGQVRFAMYYASNASIARSAATSFNGVPTDSIVFTRARFVLEHIELKSERESLEVRTSPIVAELDLSSAIHDITLNTIPFGSYMELSFEIHRVDSADLSSVPAADRPLFADFLQNGRSSVIVEGNIYKGGTAEPFTFRSRVNAEQEQEFHPPLVVSETKSVTNVTMSIQSGGWFRAADGSLLDPRDAANGSVIDENIKSSIRVFEDENHDGNDD